MRDDRDTVTAARVGVLERVRGELDHRKRSERTRDTPRRYGDPGLEHPAIARDEQNIDGKTHEKCMDDTAGRDDEGVSAFETVAAEQTTVARLGIERALEPVGDHNTRAFIPKRERSRRPTQEGAEEMGYASSFSTIAIRIRYLTGCPLNVAGLNFQAFAADTSMRSWKRCAGEISLTSSTSPVSLMRTSK